MAARIAGRSEWSALKGTTITNKVLMLTDMGLDNNIQGPTVLSPTVILDRCDKNFVAYHGTAGTLPHTTTLYLNSHPCEPYVLDSWARRLDATVYLTDWYKGYKTRWAPDAETIVLVDQKELLQTLQRFYDTEEPLTFIHYPVPQSSHTPGPAPDASGGTFSGTGPCPAGAR